MSDNLQIEIDVAGARAALEGLTQSFQAFATAAETSTQRASASVQELNKQMAGLQALPTNVLDSLTQLNNAIKNVQTGQLNEVIQTINGMGGSEAIDATAKAVEGLGNALNNLKVPEGVDQINVNFRKVREDTEGAGGGVNKFSRAVQQLGSEINHAVGYMMGFGTTAGNIINALRDLSSMNVTVGQTLSKLVEEFGRFGAAQVIIGGVVAAMKGLYDVSSMVLGPIVQIGTAFNNFKIAMDAVEGSAGAGAAVLEELRGVSERTSSSLLNLTQSYLKFRASTEAAGLASQESLTIFESFSGAFRSMGLSSVEAGRGFKALEQMFSKGKVQAEELRNQLGDILPGAFQLAAQAMGVTTQALDKLLEQGKVLPEVMIPAMAELVKNKFGDAVAIQARTAAAQLELLGNRMTNLISSVAGGGGFAGALGGIAAGLRQLNDALNSEALLAFASALGTLIGLLSGAVLGVLSGFVEGFLKAANAIISTIKWIGEVTGLTKIFADETSRSNTIMQVFAGTFNVLGQAIGIAVAAFAAYRLGNMAVIQSTLAWGQGLTTTLIPAVTTAARAVGVFSAAIWASPFGRVAIIATAVVALASPLQNLINIFKSLGSALSYVSDAFGPLAVVLSTSGAAWLGYQAAVSSTGLAVGNALVTMGSSIATWTGALNSSAPVMGKFADTMKLLWASFSSSLPGQIIMITTAIGGLAIAINEVGKFFGLWNEDVISTGQILTATATIIAGTVAVWGTVTTAVQAATAAKKAYAAVLTSEFLTKMPKLKDAILALSAAWNSSPFMKLTLVVAGVAAFGSVVYKAGEAMGYWGEEAKKVGSEIETLDSQQKTFTESIEAFLNSNRATAEGLGKTAASIGNLKDQTTEAGIRVTELEQQIKNLDRAIATNSATTDRGKESQDRLVKSYEAGIKSLERQKKAYSEYSKAVSKDLKQAGMSDLGDTRSKESEDGTRRFTQALKDQKGALDSSKDAFTDWAARQAQYGASLESQKKRLEEQIKSIKEWGIALSEEEAQMARNMMTYGESREKATELIGTYKQLTMTEQERSDLIGKKLQREKEAAEMYTTMANRIRDNIKALQEQTPANEADAASIKARIDANAAYLKIIEPMAGRHAANRIELELLQIAQSGSADITQELERLTKKYNEETGKSISGADLLAQALGRSNPELEKSSDSTNKAATGAEKLSEATKSTADKLKEAGDAAKNAQTNIDTVATGMTTISTSLSQSQETLTTAASSFTALGESLSVISTALTTVPTNLSNTLTALSATQEVVPSSVLSFQTLVGTLTLLDLILPNIALELEKIVLSATNGAPLILTLSDSMMTLSQTAPGITEAGNAFSEMIARLSESTESVAKLADDMRNLSSAAASLGEGFGKGAAGADAFTRSLLRVGEDARIVIRVMNDLKKAAEEAFRAAERASSAGGGGGGGNTPVDSSRMGGMSGEALEKQSVSPDVFKNAPMFAQGTANTSQHVSKVPGGGIPSILHPNEAVIPLSRGRKVPVDLNIMSSGDSVDSSKEISRGLNNVSKAINSLAMAAQARTPTVENSPVIRLEAPKTDLWTPQERGSTANSRTVEEGGFTPSRSSGGMGSPAGHPGRGAAGAGGQMPVNIKIDVHAEDVDGFQRSQDQIARKVAERMQRAVRRSGAATNASR